MNAKIKKENDFRKRSSSIMKTKSKLFFILSKDKTKLTYLIFHCKDTLFNLRFKIKPIFKRKPYNFLTYITRWVIFGVIRKLDVSGDTGNSFYSPFFYFLFSRSTHHPSYTLIILYAIGVSPTTKNRSSYSVYTETGLRFYLPFSCKTVMNLHRMNVASFRAWH